MSHNEGVRTRFLLGPAGSGKTLRCLQALREELCRSPEGPDLVLLAPKQATFQLERQLLLDGGLRGYTRLQILSFERLAALVFERLGSPLPELLSEEGRVMILRAILEEKRSALRVFRSSARQAGFARQLSALLRELQRHRLGPESLRQLSTREGLSRGLGDKLLDLSVILRAYLDWVNNGDGGGLQDPSHLLDAAAGLLHSDAGSWTLGGLWLDGFAEMTPQEQALLTALLPRCAQATLAFCLPGEPRPGEPWLSPWAVVSETAHQCYLKIAALPGVDISLEVLSLDPDRSRFRDHPTLAAVEGIMRRGIRAAPDTEGLTSSSPGDGVVRLVECADIEAEATRAARELLGHVQRGGRFRECAILLRSLEVYQDVLRRVLTRYEVPFFLDRREPVSHHPLAELTRFALRVCAHDWRMKDWLGVLKSGLTGLPDAEADALENAALARGWEGAALWLKPLPTDAEVTDREWLEARRLRVTGPFKALQDRLHEAGWTPDGPGLAGMLRGLWEALGVERQLEGWGRPGSGPSVHGTVWGTMNDWLDDLERAFGTVALPLAEWLQIVETGLSGLTVGVVPPALDQVLVGSVDRSRNPDLQLALVLGANESVFPIPPPAMPLLSDADLDLLESAGAGLGHGRRRFGHERYLGYIAFTRARSRLLVTWSAVDSKGRPINRSSFVDDLIRGLPGLELERFDGTPGWSDSRHAVELAGALLRNRSLGEAESLCGLPGVRPVLDQRRRLDAVLRETRLSPAVVERLHGRRLHCSVSALETFASCPFRYFAAHGLLARERDEFEVDARQTGTFQHEVLAAFHRRVMDSGRRWREIAPGQAAAWVREIGEALLPTFQHGLLSARAGRLFHARSLLRTLERAVETLTRWASRNRFEPAGVEVGFGLPGDVLTEWTLDLGGGRVIGIRGRVDRVDLLRQADGSAAMAVLDYKSGTRRFDDLKFENGLQLQMPAYLTGLSSNPAVDAAFNVSRVQPAGVFYVGLRLGPESGSSYSEATARGTEAAAGAFRHRGRFNEAFLRAFDSSGARKGEQFQFKYNKDGRLSRRGNDALEPGAFADMLEDTSRQVRELAGRILSGDAEVAPYSAGSNETACDFCRFLPICRFDSWTQPYRHLSRRTDARRGEDG